MKLKRKMNKRQPLVSVIMPVYNAGPFLWEALRSVFNQTFKNIEVIAVNDGSTDDSLSVLKKYQKKESRLRVYSLKKNHGVGFAANLAVKKARAKLIARIDADDLVPTTRIEKQVKFLQANPEVVIVGGQVELVTEKGEPIVLKEFPKKHKNILNMFFTAMALQQGAMMVKKDMLPKKFTWYKKHLTTSEDLDFFFRILKYGKGANLKDVVLHYRQHGTSITQVENPKKIYQQAFDIRLKALKYYFDEIRISTYVMMFLQWLLVTILPSRVIYPLYYIWRGIKPLNFPKYGIFPLLKHATAYLY